MLEFDNHSKVFNLFNSELAFFQLKMQVKFGHLLKDMFGAFFVSGSIREEDEEIIHVDDKSSFYNYITKEVIHESLESGGGIGETKEHNSQFDKVFMGDKGSLPLVTIFNLNIVVPPLYVKLGKDFGILQFIDEVGDEGKGIGVADGMFIQVLIVLTRAKFFIFLFNKEKIGNLKEIGRMDLSSMDIFIKKVFSGFVFFWRERI